MATTPPPITQFTGAAPQRGDRSTFSARVDAFVTWLIAMVTQLPAIALNVYNNTVEAFNSAATATNAAAAAAATANVVPWVSGTTYQQYTNVISPIDGYTYRRLTAAGSGTTDPSADAANYGPVQPRGFTNMLILRSTQNWTPPLGVSKAKITVIDGGNSGATSSNGGTGNATSGGKGGDASISIRSVAAGTTYTATVGAGGAAPASGTNNAGNAGGASSFGGSGFTTLTSATGDISIPGGAPLTRASASTQGLGGESLYALTPSIAAAGSAIGQGGGGSFDTAVGKAGAAGAVIIEY